MESTLSRIPPARSRGSPSPVVVAALSLDFHRLQGDRVNPGAAFTH